MQKESDKKLDDQDLEKITGGAEGTTNPQVTDAITQTNVKIIEENESGPEETGPDSDKL